MEHEREPLTIDRLHQLNGQPVWIEDLEYPEKSQWRLIYWDRQKYLALLSKSLNGGYLIEEYGRTWLAYASKPVDLDVWDPCEWCGEWIGGDCTPKERDVGYRLYAGFSKQVAVDDFLEDETENLNFCPVCGRPLTNKARKILQDLMNGVVIKCDQW